MRHHLSILLLFLLTAPLAAQTFLGKTPAEWAADLGRPGDPSIRRSAAFALGKLGPAALPFLPRLKEAYRAEASAQVKESILCALGDIAKEEPSVAADSDL